MSEDDAEPPADAGDEPEGASDGQRDAADATEHDAGEPAADDTDVDDSESTDSEFDDSDEVVTVPESAANDDGGGFLSNLKATRKQLGEAAAAFKNARGAGALPQDEAGRVQIVCRRHAERRAVALDDVGRPACYDADHPDCQGCLEDVRDGTVETW